MTTARPAARLADASAARAGLVALIGMVIAGIFAMHVLGSHDQDGGHAMSVTTPDVVAAHSSTAHSSSDMADMAVVTAAAGGSVVGVDPGHGMSGSMAGCILFLAAVGGPVLALMLALAVARSRNPDAFDARGFSKIRRRGPPGAAPPHFSLCVLRV